MSRTRAGIIREWGLSVHPREWATLCLFYTQEILLDAATPGKEAKERLIRNAGLLKECTETWLRDYCQWDPDELMREMWPDGNPRLKHVDKPTK